MLFAELIRRGWSDANLAKLAGGNVLRVMRRAEAVAASMKDQPPSMAAHCPPPREPANQEFRLARLFTSSSLPRLTAVCLPAAR